MSFSSWLGRSLMIFIPLAAVGALRADDRVEVEQWLDRMAQAVETLDYRGTLVHWHGDQFDALKIIHRSDESGVRERLFSLSGSPREIIRDGDLVRSLRAGERQVLVQSQLSARLLPHLPLRRLKLASEAYVMRVGNQERVAGHQTRIIEILPRDAFRYGYRFWLEPQTGMLLRFALLDHEAMAIQQLTFVEIELGARITDDELEAQLESTATFESRLSQNTPTFENLTAFDSDSSMPDGWDSLRVPVHFQLARQGQGESASGADFNHLLYSDGLASFSVYIENDSSGQMSSRLETLGSVNLYTGTYDDHQVTIVGEVPLATVRFVGQWLQTEGSESGRSR